MIEQYAKRVDRPLIAKIKWRAHPFRFCIAAVGHDEVYFSKLVIRKMPEQSKTSQMSFFVGKCL